MEAYWDYQDALAACYRTGRYALATLDGKTTQPNMRLHDCYEIYYAMQTGYHVVVMDRLYRQQSGDLFLINPYEAHKCTPLAGQGQKQMVFFIHPEYLRRFRTEQTDLSACFLRRPEWFSHRLSLPREHHHHLWSLLHRLTCVQGFGADLMEHALFLELMVWVGSLFSDAIHHAPTAEGTAESKWTQRVLTHIHEHITEPLSIESIAADFSVSGGHFCRIFCKETGSSVAAYISACRIARAKQSLAQGLRVQEAQKRCGFGDYSHFIRAFGQTVGISPKQYALRSIQEESFENPTLSEGPQSMLWPAGGKPSTGTVGCPV